MSLVRVGRREAQRAVRILAMATEIVIGQLERETMADRKPNDLKKLIERRITQDPDLLAALFAGMDDVDRANPIVPEFAPKMVEAGLDGLTQIFFDKLTGTSATVQRNALALERYFLRLVTDEDAARDHLGLPPLRKPEQAQGIEAMYARMVGMFTNQAEMVKAVEQKNAHLNDQLADILRQTTRQQGPLFSVAADAYIARMVETHGERYKEVEYLRNRKAVFLQILPDKPVGQYTASDLQTFINRVRYLPPNVSKQPGYKIEDTLSYIERNEKAGKPGLLESTLVNNYLAKIKTILRSGCADAHIQYVLDGARLVIPNDVPKAKTRLVPDYHVLGKVFDAGIASGLLAEAMLPPLGYLTGRRLSILVYMEAADIQRYHDAWVVIPKQLVEKNGHTVVVPYKTGESLRYFVLHNFFIEIGFVDWAQRQRGFLFKALHTAKDPADTASKRMGRLFREAGIDPKIFQTFHGTRHAKINEDREAKMDPRTTRLQVGHELHDVHENYGQPQLRRSELHKIADAPLPEGIDWGMFRGLDFDALAAKRSLVGRPATKARRPGSKPV